ncbi:MARVEL domain-containing protein 3 [Esox lucius]|nr:MARVEL domain-containing protein 3 [Esox lucius]
MSQPSRSHRGEGERNGRGLREHREHRPRREPPHHDIQSSSDRSSSQPPYYRDSARGPPPPKHVKGVQREDQDSSTCTHICSRRGMVLICSILTNGLVLICVVAAQMAMSGMTAMGGLSGGSFNLNTNIPFEGQELQQVRDLDMQYSQMRAPGVYGGVAFALVFGVLSLVFVVSGNKPPHLLDPKLLIGALVFQGLGAVLYVVAVGLYLHFVIQVNSTDVCKRRERMYARVGYTWMNCEVGGADAAVALFGLITAILYGAGAVLMFFTERGVRNYLKERRQHQQRETKTVDKMEMSDSSRSPLSV